jgi:hypothetical protein
MMTAAAKADLRNVAYRSAEALRHPKSGFVKML